MSQPTELKKRPKDMTDEELAAIPVKSQLLPGLRPDGTWERAKLSPYGLNGDDFLGFWQDADGQWWCEPPMFY